MALTASDYQTLVALQVADIDEATGDPPAAPEDGYLVLHGLIPLLWELHTDKVVQGGDALRYLYVVRDAARACLNIASRLVDFNEGLSGESIRRSQEFAQRKALYEAAVAAVQERETYLRTQVAGAAGARLVTRQMIGPFPGRLNPLGPGITGSPYVPLRGDADRLDSGR